MSKISKSQLIKLQVLQVVQNLVKSGLYKTAVFINTNTVKTLSIQVYCKDGVWTPYMEEYDPIEEGGVYISHCEGDLNTIAKNLDNYTLKSFNVYGDYHG